MPTALCVTLVLLLLSVFSVGTAQAQAAFTADFARPADPPLFKTRFGVYQTPLVTLPQLLETLPLLDEIGVQDFRYEIGWGKPDVLAFDQITGTPQKLVYDFATIDALTQGLRRQNVTLLLATGYCPNPLKSRTEWAAWKDLPSSLESWRQIHHDYAAHLAPTLPRLFYEIWNEPDMPDPGGKMFFTGDPADYGKLYAAAVKGVQSGDPNAAIGGPAIAYDFRYVDPLRSQPMDFASLHAYDNYPGQLANMRGALKDRPAVPIFLTEYASFTELPANGPQSRYPAAMRFFRDVRGMLGYSDLAKVYWAQWRDAGDAPGMGLLTFDHHRKAIFNAFRLYSWMPVDRNIVIPENQNDVHAMASSDEHTAAIVFWNEATTERAITINLRHLPFARGTLQVYRIDKDHASYVDNPASETLKPVETRAVARRDLQWQGKIPGESVVFLQVTDGKNAAPPKSIGTLIRTHHWFPDRSSDAYADYDPRTQTARLGMGGGSDNAVAQIGIEIEQPVSLLRVRVTTSGTARRINTDALLGLRVDFPGADGRLRRSVLYYGGHYDAKRGAAADKIIRQNEIARGQPFRIMLDQIAPPEWNRRRVLLTFILQNAGKNARAKFELSPAK